jgi:hypothetical protein
LGRSRSRKESHHARAAEGHRVRAGQPGRELDDLRDRYDGTLHIAAARPRESPHPSTQPGGLDALPDRAHDAGHLAARHVALDEPVRAERAAPDHGVDPADTDRLDVHQHRPGPGDRLGDLDDCQTLGRAERLDRNRSHRCLLHPRAPP